MLFQSCSRTFSVLCMSWLESQSLRMGVCTHQEESLKASEHTTHAPTLMCSRAILVDHNTSSLYSGCCELPASVFRGCFRFIIILATLSSSESISVHCRPPPAPRSHILRKRTVVPRSELAAGGRVADQPPPPDPAIHAGDWRNKGIYSGGAWIWEKPAPKASLYKYGKQGTATPTILNIVQLIHCIPFVPAIILTSHISTHGAALQANCGVSPLQVLFSHAAPYRCWRLPCHEVQ